MQSRPTYFSILYSCPIFSFEFCKKIASLEIKADKSAPRSRKIPNDDNAVGGGGGVR